MKILTLNTRRDPESVKHYWRSLASRYAHSYFQSSGWVETWLDSIGQLEHVDLVVGVEGDTPVLGYFCAKTANRVLGLLPDRHAFFNETGSQYYDELTVEYNQPLYDPDAVSFDAFFNDSFSDDSPSPWSRCNKVFLRALSEEFFNRLELSGPNFRFNSTPYPCYFVNYHTIAAKNCEYIETLSKNKRQQIRRSIREYKKFGDIELAFAKNSLECTRMLDELVVLHQNTWQRRNLPGSFSNRYFTDFHRRLIENRFATGEILLCKIHAGEKIVGYIYGFLYRGAFLYYQSGFDYDADNKYRPGMVSHYHLIDHLGKQGLDRYDFLLGDSQYKKSLSNDSGNMYDIVALRKGFVPVALYCCEKLGRVGRKMLGKVTGNQVS